MPVFLYAKLPTKKRFDQTIEIRQNGVANVANVDGLAERMEAAFDAIHDTWRDIALVLQKQPHS